MKTATFTYIGTPRTNHVETINGRVTLKDNGKTSISLFTTGRESYAATYAAKNLAKAIVAADFNHAAVKEMKEVKEPSGLIALLTAETTEFKAEYIVKVRESAARIFAHATEQTKRTMAEWFDMYNVPYVMEHSVYENKMVAKAEKNFYNGRLYKSIRRDQANAWDIVRQGLVNLEAKEVAHAETHYTQSIAKLAARLNDKGITDAIPITITRARVGVNIELTINHGTEITRAWTIIAEGPIQRAHYRYIVK